MNHVSDDRVMPQTGWANTAVMQAAMLPPSISGEARRTALPLRVGLVGPLPPPAGGMAIQCRQLCDLLLAEGLEVVLVQTNPEYRPAWIGRMRGVRAVFRLLPYLARLNAMCKSVDLVHILANSGWAWYLFAMPALWIARLRGVPVVINYRGGDAERFLRGAPAWVARTLSSADALITPSAFLVDVFAGFGVRADVIPNVVDLAHFRAAGSERAMQPHVIVTRNLERIYGIDTAIRAFARVAGRFESARLTIAGEGPELERLERLTADLGLAGRVRFSGRLARDAMAALYREADIMLNPSRVDNMPSSILEAYASEVPIVTTNVGGIPYMVRDGDTALMVEPDDDDAMAEAISRLMDDRALRQRFARNGALEAARYSWREVGGQWLDLYRALALGRSRAAQR